MLDFMEKSPLALMEISSAQHQIMGDHQMGEILDAYPENQVQQQQQTPPPRQEERKMRPPPDVPRSCPRCDSANTKFCYYNNYSLSQPRYFCKECRRYWTQGGTLRSVPVGGGCRKNKRFSSKSKSKRTPSPRAQASITTTTNSNHLYPNFPTQISYDPSDLTLAFSGLQSHDPFFLPNPNPNPNPNNVASYIPNGTGFLDILRTGFIESTTTTATATAGGRGFQNFYYGYGGNYYGYTGNSIVGEVESSTVSEEVLVPFEASLGVGETSSAAGEVSSSKVVDGGENKMLMGLPWQMSTGDGDYWNAVGSAPWHGLINSSLM